MFVTQEEIAKPTTEAEYEEALKICDRWHGRTCNFMGRPTPYLAIVSIIGHIMSGQRTMCDQGAAVCFETMSFVGGLYRSLPEELQKLALFNIRACAAGGPACIPILAPKNYEPPKPAAPSLKPSRN